MLTYTNCIISILYYAQLSTFVLRYSSLGNKSKSHPNPNLKYIDENTGEVKYLPAFLLQNSNSERDNRF